jgi:hypothetical protein
MRIFKCFFITIFYKNKFMYLNIFVKTIKFAPIKFKIV